MAVTYNKLWHLLIDRGMKKKDLKEAAGLTSHAMMKLRNNEDITTQTIGKICKALGCQADDIMEFFEKSDNQKFQKANCKIQFSNILQIKLNMVVNKSKTLKEDGYLLAIVPDIFSENSLHQIKIQ